LVAEEVVVDKASEPVILVATVVLQLERMEPVPVLAVEAPQRAEVLEVPVALQVVH
jgi:hypothetical protein